MTVPYVPYKEVTLEEVNFDPSKPLAFDTETCGLYGRIRLAQFYQADWDEVLLVNNPDPYALAARLNEVKSVMHNAHYDITTIQGQTESRYEPKDYEDTFLMSRLHYYNREKFDAASVMLYALGFDPYDEAGLDKKVLQKSEWDVPVLSSTQKVYAAIDVYYLLDVYDVVKEQKDTTSYKLDMHTLHHCLDIQNNGMPILEDEITKQYEANLEAIEGYDLPINVNSWKQVRPYIEYNESDALALATQTLKGNEKAGQVQTVRKLLKQNSFLTKFSATAVLGYIFGKFLPSARSGRLTSKDQNLQQLPRLLKKVFGFKTEDGKVLIYADYAQLEMRSITCVVGEWILDKLLRAGGDVHDYVAKMFFGDGFTKDQRQIAKTCNFNLLYGGGAAMLVSILITTAMMLISEAAAKGYKTKWLNLYPAIRAWQERGISDWRNGKAWKTPFGRRYTAKMMTDQLNIQNQGFGAEVFKLAIHYLAPKLKEMEGVRILDLIHDSFIIECDNEPELYKEVSAMVAEAMQVAWFEALRVGIDLKIRDLPMPVDVFVGYNWGRIEDDYLYKYELEGMQYYDKAA